MTLHELCEQARHVACVCKDSTPDKPCNCKPGDYHLARFAHARRAGLISHDDIAYIIRNFPRTVTDPGGAAA